MVSGCDPSSNSSSSLFHPLGTVPSALVTSGITVILVFHTSLSNLANSPYLSLFPRALILTMWSDGVCRRSIKRTFLSFYFVSSFFLFLFFFFFLIIARSVLVAEICLYLKIPENFMRLILLERFWFVHIPFGRMVKFQFLAHFPVDQLSHPIISSNELFLSFILFFLQILLPIIIVK